MTNLNADIEALAAIGDAAESASPEEMHDLLDRARAPFARIVEGTLNKLETLEPGDERENLRNLARELAMEMENIFGAALRERGEYRIWRSPRASATGYMKGGVAVLRAWADMAQIPGVRGERVPCTCGADSCSGPGQVREDLTWETVSAGVAKIVAAQEDPNAFEHRVFPGMLPDTFRWEGVMTWGRWATISRLEDGSFLLCWDSGTGRPSTYIGQCLVDAGLG